jgi:uncharacterized membrane protein YidH (DUF202 family)
MSGRRIVGLVLVAVGIDALLWGGVFWTRNKTVVDAGPLEIKARQHEGVAVPPIIAVGVLVAGIALVLIPTRRRV